MPGKRKRTWKLTEYRSKKTRRRRTLAFAANVHLQAAEHVDRGILREGECSMDSCDQLPSEEVVEHEVLESVQQEVQSPVDLLRVEKPILTSILCEESAKISVGKVSKGACEKSSCSSDLVSTSPPVPERNDEEHEAICPYHTVCKLRNCPKIKSTKSGYMNAYSKEYVGLQLANCETIKSLVDCLYDADVLHDFLLLVQKIVSGDFNPRNIAFLVLLDSVRLTTAQNTKQMRYRSETKEFMETIYLESDPKTLRVLGGPKSSGQQDCSGSKALFNLPVPSLRVLRKGNATLRKKLKPGLLPESVDILDKDKKYFISVDGKTVNRGLTGLDEGDIDMWGYEERPSKEETLRKYSVDLEMFSALNEGEGASISSLREAVISLSSQARRLRHSVCKWEKLRLDKTKEKEKNPDNADKYVYAISTANANLFLCKQCLRSILSLNHQILTCLAEMNNNIDNVALVQNVDLGKQQNCRILLHPDLLKDHFDLEKDTYLVKQNTEMWKGLRKEARGTGSTLQSALMLGMKTGAKCRAKDHFDTYIMKKPDKPVPPELQARFDHGHRNEVNALATVVGVFMPAFLPPCYTFVEIGPFFIPGTNVERLIEVSADGILTSPSCESSCEADHHHGPIALELKCPIPKPDDILPVFYSVQKHHAVQLLCEMAVLKAKFAWYVSWTDESATLIEATFDSKLFEDILSLFKKHFDKEKPELINDFPPEVASLKERLDAFTRNNCHFLAEMNSCTGSVPQLLASPDVSPHNYPHVEKKVFDADPLQDRLREISTSGQAVTKSSFTLLRRKACEMLVFIIADSDRCHTPERPIHIPVAYALTPKGFKVDVMRQMLHEVFQLCSAKGVQLLGMSSDGQWWGLSTKDRKGQGLTRLQVTKDVWARFSRMGKKAVLAYLEGLVGVTKDDLDSIASMRPRLNEELTCRNVAWVRRPVPSTVDNVPYPLFVTCSGKDAFCSPSLMSIQTDVSPELWTGFNNDDDEEAETTDHFFHAEYIIAVLEEIQSLWPDKWAGIDALQFHEQFLSTRKLLQKLTLPEIRCFHRVYKVRRGELLFGAKWNKADMLQLIGDKMCLPGSAIRRSAQSLKMQCTRKIEKSNYPLVVLQCAAASLHMVDAIAEWKARSTIPLKQQVDTEGTQFSMYCYPGEITEGNILCNVIDPTHILTNLRAQVLRVGLPGLADKDAFLRVAEAAPHILNKAVVVDVVDKQNASIAMQLFSKEVEDVLVSNGDVMTANFVRHVRDWYLACDERGLAPSERVRKLTAMDSYLRAGKTFFELPPPGMYCRGIPIVTFEGLMCNISMRLNMYRSLKEEQKSFNNRAWSTLASESYFSTVTSYSPMGCPRANQVSKIIADTLRLNSLKHKPEKGFHYYSTARFQTTYPIHPALSDDEEVPASDSEFFPSHAFDAKRTKKKRARKGKITSDEKPLCGVQPLRSRFGFKFDESKILPTTRLGINM